jgi:hypothetical protein
MNKAVVQICALSWLFILLCMFLYSPPWRWPHKWPKHARDHYAIKLQS